jgi:glutamate dehydrogenase/leucine dehydrogenase
MEVIPLTKKLEILHPQEGTVRGLYGANDTLVNNRLKQLQIGVSKTIDNELYAPTGKGYRIADMVTGYGVSESIRHYYNKYQENKVDAKRVIIQGWGNVGAAAGYYLAKFGYKIIGIVEQNFALVNPDGFTFSEVEKLFIERKKITELGIGRVIPFKEIGQEVYNALEIDVFVPAAASRLVDRADIEKMIDSGLELLVAGANVPFNEKDVFYGPICRYADEKISLIPDFVANCGMAETFWHLIRQEVEISDHTIFTNISATIGNLINKAYQSNNSAKQLTQTFLKMFI